MLHSILRLFLTSLLLAFAATLTIAHDGGTLLVIPAINLNTPVVPIYVNEMSNGDVTWDTSSLNMTVGHLTGLSWFGQGGNVVLGGHSELGRGQPDIFYHLDDVTIGQEIVVYAGGQEYRYQVTETKRVSARDLSILLPSTTEKLTLFTCDLGSYTNGNYRQRFVVIATRIN
jgi:LPXTG-site transpeptidase (sortase) family protein